MVRIFQILANEKQLRWLSDGLTVKSAADYTPKRGDPDYDKNNDAPWIRRFAADGGSVIISGDTNMRRQPHERLALVQQGMVTIFFEPKWSKWVFFRKCALLLNWWPAIAKTAKAAKPGSFWRVPANWELDGKLHPVSNEDARLLRIQRQIAAKETVRARRKRPAHAAEQGTLERGITDKDDK